VEELEGGLATVSPQSRISGRKKWRKGPTAKFKEHHSNRVQGIRKVGPRRRGGGQTVVGIERRGVRQDGTRAQNHKKIDTD